MPSESSATATSNAFLSAVPGLIEPSSILAASPVIETAKPNALLEAPKSVAEILNLSAG